MWHPRTSDGEWPALAQPIGKLAILFRFFGSPEKVLKSRPAKRNFFVTYFISFTSSLDSSTISRLSIASHPSLPGHSFYDSHSQWARARMNSQKVCASELPAERHPPSPDGRSALHVCGIGNCQMGRSVSVINNGQFPLIALLCRLVYYQSFPCLLSPATLIRPLTLCH